MNSNNLKMTRVAILSIHAETDKLHVGPRNLFSILKEDADVHVAIVSPSDIIKGILQQFTVIIVPGGSASQISSRLGDDGRKIIRNFVRNGGGYIGICAGAFLAAKFHDPYPSWRRENLGLEILKAETRYPSNPIGFKGKHSKAAVQFSEIALQQLGIASPEGQNSSNVVLNIRFAGGPLLYYPSTEENYEMDDDSISDFDVLGTFVKRTGKEDPNFLGAHAITSSTYGRGKVICISPHPETFSEDMKEDERLGIEFDQLHKLVQYAALHCGKQKITLPKHKVNKIEKLEAKIKMYEEKLSKMGASDINENPDFAALEKARLALAEIQNEGKDPSIT